MAKADKVSRDRLLQSLKNLEEALVIDYGMVCDAKPRTAAALAEARSLIREAEAGVYQTLRISPSPYA